MKKVVRAHNPGSLLIVNPRKRSTMVRRKRRNARRTTAVARPRRRRRSVAVRSNRRRAALVANPRRRRNRRRHVVANPRRRRRNPSAKGILVGGAWAGFGAVVTNVVAGFIPIGGGGWMDVVKQFAAAMLVNYIGERVPFIGHNAQLMAIGGFAGTAWSAVNMVLSGASGFLTPHPASTQAAVSDIVAAPSFYPGMHGLDDIVPAPNFYPQGPGGLY
jgi:hypothetical protein